MAFYVGLPKIHRASNLDANATGEVLSRDTGACQARLTLDALPMDVLVEVVRADPEGTFAFLDTSHRCAQGVLNGVLAALCRELPQGRDARAYVKACLRAGRSASDLVFLSDILGERDANRRLQRIESSGILPTRVVDALCKTLLQFLCSTPVLLEAFQMRRHSILIEDEIASRPRMAGMEMPPELGREIWIVNGQQTFLTGLDRVLLPFASRIGEAAIFEFCKGQYDHADTVYSSSGSPYFQPERPVLAAMVYGDARRVGDSLLRYLSVERGRKADCDACLEDLPVEDGFFFPIVAGHEVEVSVIDRGKPDLNYSGRARRRQQITLQGAIATNAMKNRQECCIVS